jgi:hypothetical protein
VLEQTVKPSAVIMLMMIDVVLLNSSTGLGGVGIKSTHISSLCVQIKFPYVRVSGYIGLARSEGIVQMFALLSRSFCEKKSIISNTQNFKTIYLRKLVTFRLFCGRHVGIVDHATNSKGRCRS